METFPLLPHPQSLKPSIELSCTVGREDDTLSVDFQLIDQHSQILLCDKQKGERIKGLWEKTCFEFFFAEPGASNYWEVNLSPSTSWNVFSFKSIRHGMTAEDQLQHLPIVINQDEKTGTFSLATKLPLDKLLISGSLVHVGVAAVIQTKEEKQSYWALFHPNDHPDFHDRASFVLEL